MSSFYDGTGKPMEYDEQWIHKKLKEGLPVGNDRDYLNVWTNTPSPTEPSDTKHDDLVGGL